MGRLLNRLANAFPTMKGISFDFLAQIVRQACEQNQICFGHYRLLQQFSLMYATQTLTLV